ncbi:AgrD family cyclic lactone autoinducer peptide [Paenibacillus sp. L3-i20]|nr:cyclic lactone autoinducer peptide [Paenibacillus sp. L3-i20]GKU79827.1 hypothetical protein L3i20_v242240 [Paenibacillus sp. L3-i20]
MIRSAIYSSIGYVLVLQAVVVANWNCWAFLYQEDLPEELA